MGCHGYFDLIAILSLVLFLAFITGFIESSSVRMSNRKNSSLVYLGEDGTFSGWLSLYTADHTSTVSKSTT